MPGPTRVTARPVLDDEDDDLPVVGPWAPLAAAHKRRVVALAARFGHPTPTSARNR